MGARVLCRTNVEIGDKCGDTVGKVIRLGAGRGVLGLDGRRTHKRR